MPLARDVLDRRKTLTLMVTNTPPKRNSNILHNGTTRTLPPSRPSTHLRKAGLLATLCTGLALLILLHMALSHIAGPAPTATGCSDLVGSADYTQAVHFQPATQQMSAVQMISDLTQGAPAALVQVTTRGQQKTLDTYVFGCSLDHGQPHLRQLFSQEGLAQGTLTLTPNRTLLVSTLDTSLSPDTIPLLLPLQQNIYREFAWRDGHFVQQLFPGLYPVASRAEAQALQENYNNGQQVLWHDPLATALQMAKDLLNWSTPPTARLVAQQGDTAQVELSSQHPRMTVEVTLRQLVQPGSNGLWFVTDARTKGLLLTRAGSTSEPLPPIVSSPVQFSGADALIDGHTSATLFDHTLTPLHDAAAVPVSVQPDSEYAGTLTYATTLHNQQGVLLVESLPQAQNQDKEEGRLLLAGVILQ